jgi:hypothetical protein
MTLAFLHGKDVLLKYEMIKTTPSSDIANLSTRQLAGYKEGYLYHGYAQRT